MTPRSFDTDPVTLSARLRELDDAEGGDDGWTDVGRQLASLGALASSTNVSPNRRSSPRVPLRCRAWCKERGIRLLVQVVNASRGGLLVRAPSALAVGATVMVSFKLAGDVEVAAQARVVWASRTGALSGMGLEFLGFTQPDALGSFEAFLTDRLASD